jgi:hypothetical protein
MDARGRYVPPARRTNENQAFRPALTVDAVESLSRLSINAGRSNGSDREDDVSSLSGASTVSRATSAVSWSPSHHAGLRMREREILLADAQKVKKNGSIAIHVQVESGKTQEAIGIARKWVGMAELRFPGISSLPPVYADKADTPRIELPFVNTGNRALDIKHFLEAEGYFLESTGNRLAFALLSEAGSLGEFCETVVVEGRVAGLGARSQVITVIRKRRTGHEVRVSPQRVELLNEELLVTGILERFDAVSINASWEDASRSPLAPPPSPAR